MTSIVINKSIVAGRQSLNSDMFLAHKLANYPTETIQGTPESSGNEDTGCGFSR